MDQYIKTVISVGGSAIMLVMIVCVIWYVVKDTWKDIKMCIRDSDKGIYQYSDYLTVPRKP